MEKEIMAVREREHSVMLQVDEGGGDGKDSAKKVETAVYVEGEERQVEVKTRSKRVAALDAFRGLTIVLMILVDDAGGAYEKIDHSPWNGCTLADFVMPFFLFIVGVAIALALKRIPKVSQAVKKVIIRTLKLLFWGLLLQGGYSHAPDDLSYGVDMKQIRWCGILQRIALVYFTVALIEILTTKLRPTIIGSGHFAIFSAYRWQWLGGLIAFVLYMVMTFTLYVPDWSFVVHNTGDVNDGKRFTVQCGVRGHLGPACNAVGYVDRQVWGVNHLYSQPVWTRSKACTHSSPNMGPLRKDAPNWCLAPFEPEGLLSSISAILSGVIGVHYGHVLIHYKVHSERLRQWLLMGFGLLICGIILHFTTVIPINKQLYSFSYVCFTAGAAGIVFSAFYILIDVWSLRMPFLFLEWIGIVDAGIRRGRRRRRVAFILRDSIREIRGRRQTTGLEGGCWRSLQKKEVLCRGLGAGEDPPTLKSDGGNQTGNSLRGNGVREKEKEKIQRSLKRTHTSLSMVGD